MRTRTNVILIGLPGCGKSTVGALAARRLGWAFLDMDPFIEKLAGRTVADLFAEGEPVFRDWETEACRRLCERRCTVIAAGGGVIIRPENVELLRQSGRIVFLDRSSDTIMRDVDTSRRPLLRDGPQRIRELENERAPLYREAADWILSGDRSPMEAAWAITQWVKGGMT